MFIPRWTSPVPGAIAAAFFDLFEDVRLNTFLSNTPLLIQLLMVQ